MSANTEIAAARISELITMTHLISPNNLAAESDLMTSKWFAYRFISPLAATLLFGQLYQIACKSYVRTNVDLELSKKVTGQKLTIPTKPTATFTQLWKARAMADFFSLPYDVYLTFCFEFAGRSPRNYTPRPNQLQANNKSATAWHAEFERFLKNRLPLIMQRILLPAQYRIEAYQNLAPQNALRQFLAEWMKFEPEALDQQIARWSVSKRLLPVRFVIAGHNREKQKSAVLRVRSNLSDGVLVPPDETFEQPQVAEMWPSCFGVPYAQNPEAETCKICVLASKCASLTNAILEKTGRDPKSEDPEKDRARMLTKQRVRNMRSRRKMLSATI